RPPLHFRRKAMLEQHCRGWALGELNAALACLNAAAKAARLASSIEATLAQKLIIELAAIGPQGRAPGEARP
ncbi:MAG TPA: DNA polymerase III subunit delta, partial [Hyphomicrobiaceae bacterium]|nr:DNA polymerase III subunit delta [Hyphomicrobiaceae bacterium]